MTNRTVEFFEAQFKQAVRSASSSELTLNPFQQAALPFLSGRVLDLACGLGGLSICSSRATSRSDCWRSSSAPFVAEVMQW